MHENSVKFCYNVDGEILFEYTGDLCDALNQFLWDVECNPYDADGNYVEPHIAFELSNSNLGRMSAICNMDLHGSNFSGSDLYWSCFRECNLESVNFSRCDLRGVSFNGANLKKANFENANLGFANMGFGADLSDADLTDAIFKNTVLVGAIYNSQTIFPAGFEVPDWMVKQNDDESYNVFSDRMIFYVKEYWYSFTESQRQEIIWNGFPYDIAIQKRFAEIIQAFPCPIMPLSGECSLSEE